MPLIQVKALTKLYRMGDSIVRALNGVDLEIAEGEFVAITGASGSGKSTIMHLLGCLDRPTAGTYLFDGRNVGEMSDRELARIRNKSVGFVFQTFNLINRTSALENVGIPLFYARRANTRAPANRALERVGLTPRASHTPAELSGGERQRVAIARAIVNDPILLLADEPTGNLDTRTGQQIMEIFSSLNEQGVTIVLVTHEHEVAVRAKRVVQMCDGKIVSDQLTQEIQVAGGQPPTSTPAPAPFPPAAGPQTVPAAARAGSDVADLPAAVPAVEIEPRFVAGANGALGCGLAAPLFLALAIVAGLILGRMNVDPTRFGPQNPPPPALVLLTLFSALCLLLAIVAAFLGIFWGRAVLRRIRTVPGNWIGKGRARAAWICGLVTVLVPTVLLGVNVVACVMRFSRQPGAARGVTRFGGDWGGTVWRRVGWTAICGKRCRDARPWRLGCDTVLSTQTTACPRQDVFSADAGWFGRGQTVPPQIVDMSTQLALIQGLSSATNNGHTRRKLNAGRGLPALPAACIVRCWKSGCFGCPLGWPAGSG